MSRNRILLLNLPRSELLASQATPNSLPLVSVTLQRSPDHHLARSAIHLLYQGSVTRPQSVAADPWKMIGVARLISRQLALGEFLLLLPLVVLPVAARCGRGGAPTWLPSIVSVRASALLEWYRTPEIVLTISFGLCSSPEQAVVAGQDCRCHAPIPPRVYIACA